jgi:hypothetical protein
MFKKITIKADERGPSALIVIFLNIVSLLVFKILNLKIGFFVCMAAPLIRTTTDKNKKSSF